MVQYLHFRILEISHWFYRYEVGLWGVGQGEGLGVQEAIADDPKGDPVQVEVEGGRDLENAKVDTLW